MDLKSGLTLWAKQNRAPIKYPPLRASLSCDVAVIGAGITGTLVAHELVKRGRSVVMLDKRAPGSGSTCASTALLLYETDSPLAELVRRHGRAAAIRTYVLGRRAIRGIGTIVKKLRIDCGFRSRKTLYLASDLRGLAEIKREHRLRKRAGLGGALLTRAQLRKKFGLDFPGALYSCGGAQIDAVRLIHQVLAHHSRRRRLKIFQDTRVTAVQLQPEGVRLRTARGATVAAKYVVVATGYEEAPFLKKGLVQLHSSYVVASQPLRRDLLWRERCLIWETARPYVYLRTTTDGRILIGGEDEPLRAGDGDKKIPAKTLVLLRRFRTLFPDIPFQAEFAWRGTFGETHDGLPYIGVKDSEPRILYALGYGGNGITFSQIAAKILGRHCCGQRDRDEWLFRFERKNNER